MNNIIFVKSNDKLRSFTDLKNFFFNKDELTEEVERGEDNYKPDNEVLFYALSEHKKNKESYSLLFLGNDPYSENLKKAVLESYPEDSGPLYILEAFEVPEWFSDFNVTKAPKLVASYQKFFYHEDYLPSIYRALGIS